MKDGFWAYVIIIAVVLTGAVLLDTMRGLHRHPVPPTFHVADADPMRGRQAIIDYGCGACHTIPGIRGANARVGPMLIRFREQGFVAGVLPNLPDSLAAWIENPQRFNPRTAMPNLNVNAQDARDMAAYLYQMD
jgi:cytochrome c